MRCKEIGWLAMRSSERSFLVGDEERLAWADEVLFRNWVTYLRRGIKKEKGKALWPYATQRKTLLTN